MEGIFKQHQIQKFADIHGAAQTADLEEPKIIMDKTLDVHGGQQNLQH